MDHFRGGFGTKARVTADAIGWTVAFVLAPATFYRRKKQFTGTDTVKIRRLEEFEEEHQAQAARG